MGFQMRYISLANLKRKNFLLGIRVPGSCWYFDLQNSVPTELEAEAQNFQEDSFIVDGG